MAGDSSPSPASAPVQVRCAGCRSILAVGLGVTEFICPKCRMAQRLPPQLMAKSTSPSSPLPKAPSKPSLPPTQPRMGAPSAQGVDPTKIQLPCAGCQAVLNVPHGLARFRCPQCGVDLAVDHAKLQNFLAASNSATSSGHAPTSVRTQPPLATFLSVLPLQLVPGATISMVLPAAEPHEEINEVAIDVERDEDEGGTVGETFTDYRPSKLSLGLSHPDPVVETSSLSAVQPPEPTYCLNIMDELDETNALSCLQIETIVYACQRHLHHLPTGHRAGFFIGDGAGVGKGRTIAGLIWENWQQGRHKAVWVSVGSDLKYDARRDLDDVGAKCVQVHPLNKLPYSKLDSKAIGIKNGVIFVTYSSLIASSERGRSRLQQLVQWCGQEFDGLLVFDECHKAKNLIPDAGSQPTRTGKTVLEIQESYSVMRVIGSLCALEKGGVGALELVAMDMKARRAAEFWAELRLELLSASELFADGNSNQIWRLYWASHQRFFRHMCMSAKVPAVVRLAKEALAENKCVVIGLQSTGEARTEEAVTKYGVEMEDFVSGPRELLLKLVEENYPLPPKPDSFQQGEETVTEIQRKRALDVSFKGRVRKVAKVVDVSDDDTDDYSPSESDHESTESDEEFHMCQICNTEEEQSLLLHCSGCSRHVHPHCLTPPWTGTITDDWACYTCKIVEDEEKKQDAHVADCLKRYDSAVEKKLKILDIISSLDLPNNPLDDIIDQLGEPDNVAEITGRRGMLVRALDGKGVVYQARNAKEVSMEMINMHEKQQFMDDKKLIAIISEAGSAGVSLHADRRAKNQHSKSWFQGDQDSFPVVPPGCSDDETSIQEFINEAKAALVSVGIIRDAFICNGKDPGKLSGRIVDSDMHDVARFLNRLLGLSPNIQNRLFDLFTSILDIVLHNARIEGQLDSGIVDIKAKNVEMTESPRTVHTDSLSGALTVLFTFTIDRGVTWEGDAFK
ncbi:Protein FORGETTER 1 [Zea mays]|uniref:Protein FORGETTER 1 n=1 Tax=Zea mays TaxID=4577 RepID=A0A3L6G9N2_MAIZE|nr:Protein FORGETTER 1 [Zea mays]